MKLILGLTLGLAGLSFSTLNAQALTVNVTESFTCTSNSECKRKCEARGGRWKKDKTGTTHGTCSKPAARSLSDQIDALQNQLKQAETAKTLRDAKRFGDWPKASAPGNSIGVAELKPSECAGLGGEVSVDSNCPSNVICSTEAINPATSELELFFQCIDELDGGL